MLIHNALITGSLLVNGTGYNTGSFSGSFTGAVAGTTATASYVEYNNVANKPALVSGSSQITYSGLTGIPSGIVSGSSQVTYSGLTGIPSGIVSGSLQVTYSGLTGIPSGIVSGSAQVAGFGIFATTGSNQFNGNQAITGSLTTTGQIVAQTLNVQQVTSSIVYSSGSNIFGNSISNTQQFTGSISASGSMNITPGITVTGDGSNDMFKAVRAGNTRFVVKNAVNSVGINTDTINNPLTVNGGADFSGNVGIGTTNPGYRLDISGSAGNVTSDMANGTILNLDGGTISSANFGVGIGFIRVGSQMAYIKAARENASDEAGYLTFATQTGAGTHPERLRITSTGNVGIGIASPGYKIEVAGADSQYWNGTAFTGTPLALAISNTTAGGYDPVLILQQADSGGTVKNAGAIGLVGRDSWTAGNNATQISDMYFLVRNSSGGISERMRITSGGNVGIGVTPTSGNRFWIRGSSTSSGDSSLFIQNSTPSALFLVRNDGNVGIANTSPNKKLEITTGNGVSDGIRITYNNVTSEGLDITYLNTGATTTSFDSIYNSNSAVMQFRMKTGGTPVTALSILGSGAATFGSSVTATSLTTGTNSGSSVNITTNNNNGTSGSPLQTNVNFYGYNGNLNGQIRVDDIAGTAQVGTMKFYTWNSGQVLALTLSQSGTATFSNSISTSGALFAVGDVITTGGRLLASNGNQAANTESASILLGNRGYFTTSDIGAARISAVSTGANWYNGTALAFYTNPGPDVTSTGAIERMRINSAGYLKLKTVSSVYSTTTHRLDDYLLEQGNGILVCGNANSADSIIVYSVSANSSNGAGAAIRIAQNNSTGRSINAGGTINASGADYAEYMIKAIADNIAKGDIVGINSEGKLTNIFNDAISFAVKSTDPAYVGNDSWGSDDSLNKPISLYTEEELQQYKATNEAIRVTVDRIAFSGQVPCNVTGSNVGDYIIPIQLENGKIGGQAISNPTFEQYQIAVGKVWKIMEDGRAWIAVKIG